MRALTVTQPWAGLIAAGIKLIENRSRSMIKPEDFGKPFAIHASRVIDDEVYDRIKELDPSLFTQNGYRRWYHLSRITSAVIAVATIDRAITAASLPIEQGLVDFGIDGALPDDQRRWFFGPVGYVLRDVIALPEPVPCKGRLGFWTLLDDIASQVEAQVARAA